MTDQIQKIVPQALANIDQATDLLLKFENDLKKDVDLYAILKSEIDAQKKSLAESLAYYESL